MMGCFSFKLPAMESIVKWYAHIFLWTCLTFCYQSMASINRLQYVEQIYTLANHWKRAELDYEDEICKAGPEPCRLCMALGWADVIQCNCVNYYISVQNQKCKFIDDSTTIFTELVNFRHLLKSFLLIQNKLKFKSIVSDIGLGDLVIWFTGSANGLNYKVVFIWIWIEATTNRLCIRIQKSIAWECSLCRPDSSSGAPPPRPVDTNYRSTGDTN